MKTVIAIDPGTHSSGVVAWDSIQRRVLRSWPELDNDIVRDYLLLDWKEARVICEWIQAMGMPVGQEVFQTCKFIGRLEEICWQRQQTIEYIQRPTVKARLCGNPRAKDPNVRQALIDLCGPVGTKKKPGPLHGVSQHAWSALAVAIAIDLP